MQHWEMGAKRRLNGTSKVNSHTDTHTHRHTHKDTHTHTHTHTWTNQLIESIGPEGGCFEKSTV